ncbi:NADP-dependent oxidoreductase domain [Phytophthora cactorum]|nr:NADP-dependent oxidoreductase domain [Phytophthora cactorum]
MAAKNVPTKTLPSGAKIPIIGLGVYLSKPGGETYIAVLSALKLGYRDIDTAQYYETKLMLVVPSESNEKLGLGYIDLFLLHAPGDASTRDESWRALEELQEQGMLNDIGVSNFSEAHLEKFLKTARVKPAVNQVELHPWMMRQSLVKYCKEHDILLQAYSPLARARKMEDPTLREIANDVGATPAQVLVAFSLANDFITLPKSVDARRQKPNLDAVNVKLSSEQVEKLAALDEYLVVGWDPTKDHAVEDPVVGLGVFQSEPGAETYNAVLSALTLGYRHIDTAQYYQNEADVGRAIKDSAHLDKFLKTAKVKPAVNQVELHPWLMRPTLVKYCKEHDILLEAYSPLAKAGKLADPTLLQIANEVGAMPAQVLVAFSLANDFITLPKSVNPDRQKANLDAANVKLTPAHVAKLAALDDLESTSALMSANIPTKNLPSGAEIPVVGLGVYQSEPGPETCNAVLSALKLGYRHIDTAQYYDNEGDVGRAIKDSGIPREEIFVTSKLSIFNWGWRALEELHEHGILKDIGVSNFGEAHLEKLLKTAKVRPAVNQVELHPWLMRPTLVKYCQERGILIEAYSPLARAQKMENPTLLEISKEVDASPAQVLVAFSLANGFITLPKSVHEERQKSNFEAATIKLTPAQIAKLAALDEYWLPAGTPSRIMLCKRARIATSSSSQIFIISAGGISTSLF